MKLRKTAAVFAIIIGIAMFGVWIKDLSTGQVSELSTEPIAIIFTIVAESLTAVTLIIGGIGLIKKQIWGLKVFLLSMGFLLYSVVNATGYFGQNGDFFMLGSMVVFFTLGVIFAAFALQRERHVNQ
jgi:hypothetical protein